MREDRSKYTKASPYKSSNFTEKLQRHCEFAIFTSTVPFKGPESCLQDNQTVYSANNAERNRNNRYFEGVHQPFIECGRRPFCMPKRWLQRCPCVTERVIITPACDVQAFTRRARGRWEAESAVMYFIKSELWEAAASDQEDDSVDESV